MNSMKKTKQDNYKSICRKVFVAETLDEINVKDLLELGVETVLVDYDGTLTHHPSHLPDKNAQEFIIKLRKIIPKVIIFSNNWYYWKKRRSYFASMNVPYIVTWKPFSVLWHRKLGENCLLIGDKYITDGLFGIFANIPVILVNQKKIFL